MSDRDVSTEAHGVGFDDAAKVTVTQEVWDDCVSWPSDNESTQRSQEGFRLWTLLVVARRAVRTHPEVLPGEVWASYQRKTRGHGYQRVDISVLWTDDGFSIGRTEMGGRK